MKKVIVIAWSSALVLVALVFAYSKFKATLPKPLRTPTPAQIANAFPGKTREIFEYSDEFILFSLDPRAPVSEKHQNDKTGSYAFHGWRVLGKTIVTQPEILLRLRRAYDDGLTDETGSALCFSPRHGIRATKNGKVLDLVICFQCQNIQVISMTSGKILGMKHIGKEPQKVFDAVLSEANVPLSPH